MVIIRILVLRAAVYHVKMTAALQSTDSAENGSIFLQHGAEAGGRWRRVYSFLILFVSAIIINYHDHELLFNYPTLIPMVVVL